MLQTIKAIFRRFWVLILAVCGVAGWGFWQTAGSAIQAWIAHQGIQTQQAQFDKQTTPYLVQQGKPTFKNGFTFVLFKNKATGAKATIDSIEFEITDKNELSLIEQFRPKPKPDPHGMCCSAYIEPDEVYFEDGNWNGDDCYTFFCSSPMRAEESDAVHFQLAIDDPKLVGRKFHGKLFVHYDADEPAESSQLEIGVINTKAKVPRQPSQHPNRRTVRLRKRW